MSKIDALLSYFYVKKDIHSFLEYHSKSFNFILDSGAFSAFKLSKEIKPEDYISYLHNTKIPYEWYFTLDKIGDPVQTRKNYTILKNEGLLPVPIFTRGDTEQEYLNYYNDRKFIGIGGIAGTQGNKEFLYRCMETFGEGTKQHWLGFWQRDFLLRYKPYSCDTMAWGNGRRYGNVFYYKNRQLYQIPTVSRILGEVCTKRQNLQIKELKRYSQSLGIPDYIYKQKDYWLSKDKRVPVSQLITTCAMLEYIKMIKEKIGTRIFLVASSCNTPQEIQTLLHCKKILENGFNGFLKHNSKQLEGDVVE